MSKKALELDESSGEESNPLNTSNDYALKYDNWRRKEEIQKLKDKYGNNLDLCSDDNTDDDDDDSDLQSSTDDSDRSSDDASLPSEEEVFDEQFFKIYSALKNKNPVIYDKNHKFIDENNIEKEIETNDREDLAEKAVNKKMSLKDYHKKLIQQNKGITEEDEQMAVDPTQAKGYYEELYEIKNEFKTILNDDQNDDSDDDELIKGKIQSLSDNKKTINFLDENNSENKDIDFLKNYWKNNELEESEHFLKDYIINKRYVNQKHVFTSQPLLENRDVSIVNQNNELSNNDDNDNQNDIKINKYHFEEPESTAIKRYPRTLDSIRNTTDNEKRSLKRVEVKERKKREKDKELKRLKKLKKEELKEKLEKLKTISGNKNIDIEDLDLNILIDDENNFDSTKYDQKMDYLFGDNFYANTGDELKPKFDFIHGVDDFEYNEEANDGYNETETNDGSNSSKKRGKNKNKLKNIKSIDEIGIYEDLIGGDLATRYRYRSVEANNFGLTDEEILYAEDKELNKWCSIKKMSQYRNDEEEKYDIKSYANKAYDIELKKKILKSFYSEENGHQIDNSKNNLKSNDNKLKKKKKRRYRKPTFNIQPIEKVGENITQQNSNSKPKTNIKPKFKKQKNKPKQKQSIGENVSGVGIDRLKAYGLSNRQIKKIKHKSRK